MKTTLALLGILALSACGGGDGTASSDQLAASGQAQIDTTLKSADGEALADADVLLPVQSKLYGTKSDSKGRALFRVPAAEFSNISPVALIVHKDGYRASTYYFTSLEAGKTYTVDNPVQTKLADGEFVPEGGYLLYHVGDDNFGGSVNSQLQASTLGTSKSMKVTTITADMKAKYKSYTVSFAGRGIQTGGSNPCADFIWGYQPATGPTPGFASVEKYPPAPSPNDGSFGSNSIRFSTASLVVGADLWISVQSGRCSSTDLDDFEVTGFLVKFEV